MSDPETSREHEVGMALHHLTSAMSTVCEMARSPEHRDLLVRDLSKISEVTLAAHLVWSQLRAREAA